MCEQLCYNVKQYDNKMSDYAYLKISTNVCRGAADRFWR